MPLIEEVMMCEEQCLAKYLGYGLEKICDHLELRVKWITSSDLNKNNELRGQEKILSICRELGAEQYVNMPGGIDLYSRERFKKENIKLSFLVPKLIEYKQFGKMFEPSLSILDVMMFNDRNQCAKLLQEYSLV